LAVRLDDQIIISTPEGVDVEITLAGLGSRAIAGLLDLTIEVGALFALFLVFGATLGGNGSGFVTAAFIAVLFVVLFGYFVLFEVLNHGRTPGKAAVGLRVLRTDGGPVGFMPSAVRNLLRLVDGWDLLTLVLCPIGVVAVIATAQNQRLGDLAAGTVVARERFVRPPGTFGPAVGTFGPPPGTFGPPPGTFGPPPGTFGPPVGNSYPEVPNPLYPAFEAPVPMTPHPSGPVWDVSAVTGEEVATVRRFLERRYSLDVNARIHLANELAARLRPKVPGADTSWPPEAFLEALATAKTGRA
jgi:uncharacterized RDD family membrane protein YckC